MFTVHWVFCIYVRSSSGKHISCVEQTCGASGSPMGQHRSTLGTYPLCVLGLYSLYSITSSTSPWKEHTLSVPSENMRVWRGCDLITSARVNQGISLKGTAASFLRKMKSLSSLSSSFIPIHKANRASTSLYIYI